MSDNLPEWFHRLSKSVTNSVLYRTISYTTIISQIYRPGYFYTNKFTPAYTPWKVKHSSRLLFSIFFAYFVILSNSAIEPQFEENKMKLEEEEGQIFTDAYEFQLSNGTICRHV